MQTTTTKTKFDNDKDILKPSTVANNKFVSYKEITKIGKINLNFLKNLKVVSAQAKSNEPHKIHSMNEEMSVENVDVIINNLVRILKPQPHPIKKVYTSRVYKVHRKYRKN